MRVRGSEHFPNTEPERKQQPPSTMLFFLKPKPRSSILVPTCSACCSCQCSACGCRCTDNLLLNQHRLRQHCLNACPEILPDLAKKISIQLPLYTETILSLWNSSPRSSRSLSAGAKEKYHHQGTSPSGANHFITDS